jgi:phosphoadenosine phosphosulfate reductase
MSVAIASTSKAEAASAVIASALERSGEAALTCSFQTEDMVVLYLVRDFLPSIPVLFLETGYHFSEVYEYRDRMAALWNINLVNVLPRSTVAEQESEFGLLYQTQPDQCCKRRKVEPLFGALAAYDVWFTGLRRVQSPTRANLQAIDTFSLASGKTLLKVSPLADWTDKEVLDFATEHDIPRLPLYEAGYTSIGCQPCTLFPLDPASLRSGRWSGRKLECGIHIAETH